MFKKKKKLCIVFIKILKGRLMSLYPLLQLAKFHFCLLNYTNHNIAYRLSFSEPCPIYNLQLKKSRTLSYFLL